MRTPFKKLTAMLLAVMLVLSMCVTGISVSAAEDTKAIYFAASSDWETADARFAVYAWGDSVEGSFTSMTEVEDGIYTAEIANNSTSVIFVRMNPETTENNWDNKWNQTADLTIPADKNCFTVNAGEWDGANGTWSTYTPVTTEPATTAPAETTEPATTEPATTPVSDATIYLVAGSDWEADDARFAAYAWGDGVEGTFTSMTEVEDGIYAADLAEGCISVIFVRMNPSTTENNWDNKWNQTADLTIPTDKNCFTINAGEWDGANGTWSVYTPVTTEPETDPTEPETTQPETDPTEPETTEPATTEPATTEPATTEPATTEPATTEPETTQPVTTEPVLDETIYFVPGSDWETADARFAVYVWADNASAWLSMTEVADGVYATDVPKVYSNIIFARMNPETTENNWDNKWNQTADLTIPAEANCFTVNAGEWEGANGTWSVYVPVTTEPVTTEPVETTEPTTEPATTEPVTTEPVTTEPVETTEPATTPVSDDAIYFVAGSDWETADARFAVYAWGDGVEGTFTSMTEVEDGIYAADLADGCTNVIFVRMNPEATENNWDNKWNQTADLTIPADANCFTVNAGEWEGANGTWSVYVPVTTEPVETTEPTTEPATTEPATTPVSNDTIYFVAGSDWETDDARFAAYAWGDGVEGTFTSMTEVEDGVYAADLAEGCTNVIFLRMNPETTENNWDNKWNQTADLTIPADANCFTVNAGEWEGANGTWSVYVPVTTEPVETTEPETDPTEPETDPTEPETDPTEPESDPTEPETEPTTTPVEETLPADKVTIYGDFDVDLTEEDTNLYSGTVDLDAGTYTFRVNEFGTKHCFGGTYTDIMYGITYSPDYSSATTFVASGGRYTFQYNIETNLLVITFKPYSELVELFGDVNVELLRATDTVFSGSARLDAGEYTFRINEMGQQMCFGYTFTDSVVDIEFKSEWTGATTFVATGGIYTINYNTETNKLTFMHAPQGLGEVRIFGGLGIDLAVEQGTSYYSASKVLEAGEYTFRIDEFGTTMCFGGEFTDTMYELTYRSDWRGATTFTATGGKYTFRYNTETDQLTIFRFDIEEKVSVYGDIELELSSLKDGKYVGQVTLEAGTYSFRIDDFGTSYCFGGTFTDAIENVTYSSEYQSATTFIATGGTYSFLYDQVTHVVSVTKGS